MLDGLQAAIDQFIEQRLETLLTSDEYAMYTETIYKDLEEKLFNVTKTLEQQERLEVVEDIKSNIYDQVFFQSRQAYRQAFSDAAAFLIQEVLIQKKFN